MEDLFRTKLHLWLLMVGMYIHIKRRLLFIYGKYTTYFLNKLFPRIYYAKYHKTRKIRDLIKLSKYIYKTTTIY